MLTTGSQIMITEEGQCQAVETLQIGAFVYDPFSDTYCEIIDILIRRIAWSSDISDPDYRLAPIHIPRSALGPDLPCRDITVSPGQVMHNAKSIGNGSRYNILTRTPVLSLIGKNRVTKARGSGSVTYHALFTSDAQILNVGGLYLETLTPDLFRGPAPSRAPAAQNAYQ